MITNIILSLGALASVVRAPVTRVVTFDNYINGYSIVSDTQNAYSTTFDDSYNLTSINGAFTNNYTPMKTRSWGSTTYSVTATSTINLITLVHSGNNFAGSVIYSTGGTGYSYSNLNVTGDYIYYNVVWDKYTGQFTFDTNDSNCYYSFNFTGATFLSYTGFATLDTDYTDYARFVLTDTIPNFATYYNAGHSYCFSYNLVTSIGNLYDEGYMSGNDDGFEVGYDTGYDAGINEGYERGYDVGYNAGYNAGLTGNSTFAGMLFTIADVPIYYLKSLFNFKLFGMPVYTAILSLITLMVITFVVKKFV